MRWPALMLALWPALAPAGWYPVGSLEGSPQDVQIVDAGVVLATSSTIGGSDAGLALWRVADGGVVTPLGRLHGSFVGGASWGAGCLAGAGGNALSFSAGCGTSFTASTSPFQRFRLLSPAPRFVGVVSISGIDTPYSGTATAGSWGPVGPFSTSTTNTRSLQAARLGDVDYAVMASSYVRLSIDGGTFFSLDAGAGLAVRDAVPFVRAGRAAVAVTSATGTLHVFPDVTSAARLDATQPPGSIARFLSMNGAFGMATTVSGELLSPVPDPARAGLSWRVRDGGPPGPLERLSCVDARWCAALSDAGAVWFYENEARPEVTLVLPAQLDAGVVVRLVADAVDLDGDPVFVRWNSDAGVFTPVAGVEEGTAIDFSVPLGACVPSVAITAIVTDGLTEHERALSAPLIVVERGAVLVDAGTLSPLAGGPDVSFSAAVQGGCEQPSLAWSADDGQQGTGGQFTWLTPATECSAAPRQVSVTLTASWSTGAPSSTQTTQVLSVQPWGAPSTPSFPSPATQASGSVATWLSTGAEHACSTTGGFPGTELLWTVDAGGVAWEPVDGGLRVTAPATCVPLRLTGSAVRQVVGETAGRRSDAGLLVVDIPADVAPLGPGTPFTLTADAGGGLVSGLLDVTASCLAVRDVFAEVAVAAGPTVLTSGTFPTPGPWQLGIPGGCAGGVYDVTARLFEDGGFTGAQVATQVSLTPTPARVGELARQRLDVVCGEGLRADVELVPAPGACATAERSWRALSGPALVSASGVGSSISLQTQALDFSVVGQPLTLELSADAGLGNGEVVTRELELGVQPFIDVSVHPSPPLRREEEPLVLELVLRNPTACAVDGLSVWLPLSGASVIEGTVLLEGQPMATRTEAEAVVVDGISLPASGERRLVLRARPRLLSSPALTPVVRLSGYVVSVDPAPAVGARGCGCASLDAVAFALALLLLSRRRRAAR